MRSTHAPTLLSRFTDWPIARHAAEHPGRETHSAELDTQMSAWPTSVDDLVDWLVVNGQHELPGHSVSLEAYSRAAATLARRDGACDALIASALLHKLPGAADAHDRSNALPLPWLRTLFPDHVLGPIRLMAQAQTWLLMGDQSGPHHDFLERPHALRALRLCGFAEAAYRREAIESALPWSSLRPILRRCALD